MEKDEISKGLSQNDLADSCELGANVEGTCDENGAKLTQRCSPDVQGYVYFMQSGDAIKIGFSIQPIKRVDELQIGNPDELQLLGAFAGTLQDEQNLHADFSHLEIRNEWFRAEDELLDFIEEVSGRSIERDLRPRVSPATMDIVKGLLRRRQAAGADSPLGHRYSNLAEQIRNFENADGEQRTALTRFIAKSIAEIEHLAA